MHAAEKQRRALSTVDLAVRRELIFLLFGSPSVPLTNGIVTLVTAGVLWRIFPVWMSLSWLIVSIGIVFLRLVLWSQFQKRESPTDPVDAWGRRFTVTTAMMGCSWGLVASTAFVAREPIDYFFAAFVVAGLSAGSAIRLSPHPPAFYAFIGTAASPMVLALFMRGHLISFSMGALQLAFVVAMILVGRENHQRLADSIRIKIEQEFLNVDLQKVTLDLSEQIAEKERIALALEESSERFQAIGESALDAIVISDSGGRVVYWNPAAVRTFGFTAEDIAGRDIHSILAPPQVQEKAVNRYKYFAATGEGEVLGSTVRLRALRKDGHEFPADLSVSTMNLGGRRHALGIVRDVSDQERARQAQEERQRELEEAQRLAHIGSWSYDPHTRVTTWSEEMFRIFGRDPELSAPDPAEGEALLPAESRDKLALAVQTCLDHGLPFELDLELRSSDPGAGWVSMRGEVRRDANGGMLLRGTCQDITGRKSAEALAREQESMFRSLVEQNMSGILIIAEDRTIAYLNPAALEMLGFPDDGLVVGRPVLEMVSDPDKTRAETAVEELLSGRKRVVELAATARRMDGKPLDVLVKSALATFRGKRAIITVLVDITERRRAEDEIVKLNNQMADTLAVLRRRECELTTIAKLSDMLQSCRTVTEAYPIIADTAALLFPLASGSLALVNGETQEFTRVATWGPNQSGSLLRFQEEDCRALQTEQECAITASEHTVQCLHRSTGKGKSCLCLALTVQGKTRGLVSLVLADGSAFDDAIRQVLHSFADVVKLSLSNLRLRETLVEQAFRDPLTGLFNRRYLMETLPREIRRAQRRRAPLTIAMLDIDHFKKFNDVYGHDAGDLVLGELGGHLARTLRADDVACRYGGEEFLVDLPGCNLPGACQRMASISLEMKSRASVLRGKTLPGITLSIGLAALSDSLPTSESLITATDKAMYAAKRLGRGRIECFEVSPSASIAKTRP
jgi:diguanylate cyclase (GGDEF)-like protein/PAS domain S-box-containing protein